jgi:competence protein ComEC
VAGALWALASPAPDLLVTGDGRHLAVHTQAGQVAVLRERAGDYVRSTMAESSGLEGVVPDLDDVEGAACNDDACAFTLWKAGRPWRVLGIRTKSRFDAAELAQACAAADVVVSDRRLPRACAPSLLKADAAYLARTGGIAVRLGDSPRIETVAARRGAHPWAPLPVAKPRRRPYRARNDGRQTWPPPH